jgi:hypothetical protein
VKLGLDVEGTALAATLAIRALDHEDQIRRAG